MKDIIAIIKNTNKGLEYKWTILLTNNGSIAYRATVSMLCIAATTSPVDSAQQPSFYLAVPINSTRNNTIYYTGILK
jgi:hypothetical protein